MDIWIVHEYSRYTGQFNKYWYFKSLSSAEKHFKSLCDSWGHSLNIIEHFQRGFVSLGEGDYIAIYNGSVQE